MFLRENLAIEPPSGKVTEAAIHKQVRPQQAPLSAARHPCRALSRPPPMP